MTLTEKGRMHSDSQKLEVAEGRDKYSSAQKQYPDYTSTTAMYLKLLHSYLSSI